MDSYVDGNRAYVIVNNMHHEARTVDLYMHGAGDAILQSIYIKHLHAENAGIPALDESTVYEPVQRIDIGREATLVLEYTFDRDIVMPDSSAETKYYADTYFQRINASQALDFNIPGVALGEQGEAVLRLGVGRGHGSSLQPVLTVNGTTVEVPVNLRGDDQRTRDQFFGVIEIAVPYELLAEDNSISVTFPDTDGHVSSLSMQVFNFSREVERSGEKILDVELSEESRMMKPGKQFQLEASVYPGSFENQNISWHSTNTMVATVSNTGLIESVAEGSASIVVTTEVDQLTDTCHVEVSITAPDILAESIHISPRSLSLIMSSSSPLATEVLPLDVDNKMADWQSSNSAIASVTEEGLVTGLSLGKAYIIATTTDGSELSDSIQVNITPLPNSIDCSLFPYSLETDSVLSFEVKYTLGDTMDIAVKMIKAGVSLPWFAEDQGSVDPGAGSIIVAVQVKDLESGMGVLPDPGKYIVEAYIRPVGDADTNLKKCFKSVNLTERTVGIANNVRSNQGIEVYPNPADNSIKLKGTAGRAEQVIIYNMQGKPCLEFGESNHDSYDISRLVGGVYMIKIIDGASSEVLLFIKN